MRIAVVAHKGGHDVVEDKGRGKQKDDAQISNRMGRRLLRRTEQGGERFCGKRPQQGEQQRKQKAERGGNGEGPACALVLLPPMENGENRPAADAQQGADAEDQVIDWQADVQGREAELSHAVGDKVGIRQNIKGEADHADDAGRHVSEKNAGHITL